MTIPTRWQDLYERSKNDHEILVGSDVRALCRELGKAEVQILSLQGMRPERILRLGDRATDIVSGLSGIVVARVEYIAQETEYLLLLRPEDGKSPDSYYVAEKRLLAGSIKELQELKGEL